MNNVDQRSVVLPTSFLRRLAERVLGNITITRRLPINSGSGAIVVNARVGGLKYLLKHANALDPELLRVAGSLIRLGDCVWDVGANVGLFSMAASHHSGSAGSVIAIEADQDAVSLLFKTARHMDGRVTVLPIAVSDHDGFVRFSIARRARAANAIEGYGSTQTGGVLEVRTLPAWRLDGLAAHFEKPDVLKIDVEGAELRVLQGAGLLLANAKPRIYCEVTGTTRVDVVTLLQSAGYAVFDGESFGTSKQRAVSPQTTNLVALPIGGERHLDVA